MKKLLIIVLFTMKLYADNGYTLVSNSDLASQHSWDHLGVSFAIQTFNYGLAEKALRMEKTDAFLFSLMMTFFMTTLYNLGSNNSNSQFVHDTGMNMIGAATSVGTCLIFQF